MRTDLQYSFHGADEQVNIVPTSMAILNVAENSNLRVNDVATICTEMSLCQMGVKISTTQEAATGQYVTDGTLSDWLSAISTNTPFHLKNIAMQNVNQVTSSWFIDTVLQYWSFAMLW